MVRKRPRSPTKKTMVSKKTTSDSSTSREVEHRSKNFELEGLDHANDHINRTQSSGFLRVCFFCNGIIDHGDDIFMYRYTIF